MTCQCVLCLQVGPFSLKSKKSLVIVQWEVLTHCTVHKVLCVGCLNDFSKKDGINALINVLIKIFLELRVDPFYGIWSKNCLFHIQWRIQGRKRGHVPPPRPPQNMLKSALNSPKIYWKTGVPPPRQISFPPCAPPPPPHPPGKKFLDPPLISHLICCVSPLASRATKVKWKSLFGNKNVDQFCKSGTGKGF